MPSLKRRLEMWGKFEVFLVDLFMTGLTDISADVLGCILLRRRAFLLRGPSRSRLDGEHNDEQKENGRCGRGEDLASEFHKLHTSNCQSLEAGIESENWQKWQY